VTVDDVEHAAELHVFSIFDLRHGDESSTQR